MSSTHEMFQSTKRRATQEGTGVNDDSEIPSKVSRLCSSEESFNTQPGFLESSKRYVYAIGGMEFPDSRPALFVERYDIDSDHPRGFTEQSTSSFQAPSATAAGNKAWTHYDYLEYSSTSLVPREGMGVTLHKGIIWVAGGWLSENTASALVCTYDLENRVWKERAQMSQARAKLGLIAYHGKLYAIGGMSFGEALKTMEVYNDGRNIWEPSHELRTARYGFGTTLWRDRIFIAGGNSKPNSTLYTIDHYRGDKWEYWGSLKARLHSMAICVVNNTLYAVGGRTVFSISYLKDEDRMNWKCYEIDLTLAPCRNMSVAVINEKIYLFGGFDERKTVYYKSVFRFDPVTESLARMESMHVPRRSPGIIIMWQ